MMSSNKWRIKTIRAALGVIKRVKIISPETTEAQNKTMVPSIIKLLLHTEGRRIGDIEPNLQRHWIVETLSE